MKILHINFSDTEGGASRAAFRLHNSLLDSKIDSKFLVSKKNTSDDTVICLFKNKNIQNIIYSFRHNLDGIPLKKVLFWKNYNFSAAWVPSGGLIRLIETINPDLVHLHWICGGMIRIEDLKKIKKPIVWSLHDMWPFTGGCHYTKECEKYIIHCNSCPELGSEKYSDLSYQIFSRKLHTYGIFENMVIVGLSNWMADCAKKSPLFCNKHIQVIPNPIDVNDFSPIERAKAREALFLKSNIKYILFGALSPYSDIRKGFIELKKAIQLLPFDQKTEIIVFGSENAENVILSNHLIHNFGIIHEDTLKLLYCAVNVMIVPSLQENLSNVIMESLACGTPVIAFNIGGNQDLIDHKINGYLVEPYNPVDFAQGINWILSNPDPQRLSIKAREKAVTSFSSSIVSEQYIRLYNQIIQNTLK